MRPSPSQAVAGASVRITRVSGRTPSYSIASAIAGVCIAPITASISATSISTATRVGFSWSTNVLMLVTPSVHSWQADYPAPSNFLDVLLSCPAFQRSVGLNLNASEFCDRAIDRRIQRSVELQPTDPAAANALWSRIDRELVDTAPLVPLVNPKQVDFLSQRVGNYQYGLPAVGRVARSALGALEGSAPSSGSCRWRARYFPRRPARRTYRRASRP